MKNNQKNIFQNVGASHPGLTAFDLGHEVKMTTNFGDLRPFFCQEVVPGDIFRMNTEMLVRMMPLIAPVMHRVNVYTHYWFVPYRLLWDNWQEFITGGDDGTAAPVFPTINVNDIAQLDNGVKRFCNHSSLWNSLGFPASTNTNSGDSNYRVSALPFRAYAHIWNEFYRDQNLQDKIPFSKDDGAEDDTDALIELLTMRKRNWEKDYFTSCLPTAQKGAPVSLPLGGSADIILDQSSNNQQFMRRIDNDARYNLATGSVDVDNDGTFIVSGIAEGNKDANLDPNHTLKVDLTTATASTINDMREAFQVQRFLELLMRGGSRYTEVIESMFGVKSSDARLQRPEYLGGGQTPIVMTEIPQTSQSTSGSPQANLAGKGIGVGNTNSFSKHFEEHGLVIGLVSVLPRTAYQQGMPKQFRRFDRLDYYWPQFAHLGEQEVRSDELRYIFSEDENSETNSKIFGYQSRYAEMRYIPSRVMGSFNDELDFWHLGRKFNDGDTTPIALNGEFISTEDIDNRIFAVQTNDYDHIIIQMYNDLLAIRPMPFDASPGLIDHG